MKIARKHFNDTVMSAHMIGHKVCFGEYERKRGTKGPGALSANEMDVLDVRVSRDHSINAAASWQWLTHPEHSTRYDMRQRSHAVDGAPHCYLPVYPPNTLNLSIFHSLCHRSIALAVSAIFLSLSLRVPFLPYRPTSRLANKVRRSSLVAITSRLFRRIVSVAFNS